MVARCWHRLPGRLALPAALLMLASPPQLFLSPLIECFRQSRSKHFIQNLFSWQPSLAASQEKVHKKILSFCWKKLGNTFSFSQLEVVPFCHPAWGDLFYCFFPSCFLPSPFFRPPLLSHPISFFPFSPTWLYKNCQEGRGNVNGCVGFLSKLSVFHSKK